MSDIDEDDSPPLALLLLLFELSLALLMPWLDLLLSTDSKLVFGSALLKVLVLPVVTSVVVVCCFFEGLDESVVWLFCSLIEEEGLVEDVSCGMTASKVFMKFALARLL